MITKTTKTTKLFTPTFKKSCFNNKFECNNNCDCKNCIVTNYHLKHNNYNATFSDTIKKLNLNRSSGDSVCYIIYKNIIKEKISIWKNL
jgi:hypothetical protein